MGDRQWGRILNDVPLEYEPFYDDSYEAQCEAQWQYACEYACCARDEDYYVRVPEWDSWGDDDFEQWIAPDESVWDDVISAWHDRAGPESRREDYPSRAEQKSWERVYAAIGRDLEGG